MKIALLAICTLAAAGPAFSADDNKPSPIGYSDTPVIPGTKWKVHDIVFTAPKLDRGRVVEPAYITTFVNGVCVQNHTKIMGPTMHKKTTNYDGKFPEQAPIRLQDHKNDPPVRMRNIWIRPL